MGVEWSSCRMTRSPLGRENSVYLMGGRAGASAFAVEAFAPPLDFCASTAGAGAQSRVTSAVVSRRFQSMVGTSESLCGGARPLEGSGRARRPSMLADESGELFEEAATRSLTPPRPPAQRSSEEPESTASVKRAGRHYADNN